MYTAIYIIAAYLIGSISFAIVVSKVFKLADPRTYGSKNPGATNVLRSGHKVATLLTLLGDVAKGWLVVFVGIHFGKVLMLDMEWVPIGALMVFMGHLWPLFAQFKGGKGVATALGVLLGISPLLGLIALVTWIVVAFISRYSSLSAIVTAVLSPFYYGIMFSFDTFFIAIAIMSVLLLFRHASNIENLIRGTESKIGKKKA